jgi:hypothetical protein
VYVESAHICDEYKHSRSPSPQDGHSSDGARSVTPIGTKIWNKMPHPCVVCTYPRLLGCRDACDALNANGIGLRTRAGSYSHVLYSSIDFDVDKKYILFLC